MLRLDPMAMLFGSAGFNAPAPPALQRTPSAATATKDRIPLTIAFFLKKNESSTLLGGESTHAPRMRPTTARESRREASRLIRVRLLGSQALPPSRAAAGIAWGATSAPLTLC